MLIGHYTRSLLVSSYLVCCGGPAEDTSLNMTEVLNDHVGMAHTRWATHGPPSDLNSHPHRSDPKNTFLVVHNGIITNYRELKQLLERQGYVFETETDTEVIAKLAKYIYDTQTEDGENNSFEAVVKAVVKELQGAYALIFKSSHFPNEMIATRRGSPLLLGIRSKEALADEKIEVSFSPAPARKCMSSATRSQPTVFPANGADWIRALSCDGWLTLSHSGRHADQAV